MTLRQIRPQDVRLGMYVERIEGDWLTHPFWRKGFVLSDLSDVEKLNASGLDGVVIDESKSIGLTAVLDPSSPSRKQSVALSAPARLRPDLQVARIEQSLVQCRRAMGQIFAESRMGRSVSADGAAKVVIEITHALEGNTTAVLKLTSMKSLDNYTYVHSIAVSALMVGFSRHLLFDDDTIQLMGMAGLMHDVGKVKISGAILTKSGALGSAEIDIIRTHPRIGHEILQRNEFPDLVLDVALHHHEKIDGTGYPDGCGSDLSSAARIAAICDVYDALTSVRPYKKPWTPIEALSQMARWNGHFDPTLLSAFAAWLNYDEAATIDQGTSTDPFVINGYSDPSDGSEYRRL